MTEQTATATRCAKGHPMQPGFHRCSCGSSRHDDPGAAAKQLKKFWIVGVALLGLGGIVMGASAAAGLGIGLGLLVLGAGQIITLVAVIGTGVRLGMHAAR